MKTTSNKGIDLIKRFEGCHLKAYKCPAGVWTIGFGHTGNDVKEGVVWTQQQADNALKADLKKFENNVNNMESQYGYELSQNQFDALVSFTYNLGNGNLLKLTGFGSRPVEDFPKYMISYVNANGTKLQGLVNRRNAEVELFKSGQVTGETVPDVSEVLPIVSVSYAVKGNYNIREFPSASGKVINSTTRHPFVTVKGISADGMWLLTQYGWINHAAFYDTLR